jgi:hypothetical protein
VYRRSPRDRSARDGNCPSHCRHPHPFRRVRALVADAAGKPLPRGLANEIRMTGSGDLLMRLRKHSIHRTAAGAVVFLDYFLD